VARSRALDAYRDQASGNPARAFDHFRHRVSTPGAEIQEIGPASVAKMFERANMGLGEIGDVNVITDGRSVGVG
jgi:hypothetical protein